MVITDFLERNARLYGSETALVEINPSEELDKAASWREMSLVAAARPDMPYRREISWKDLNAEQTALQTCFSAETSNAEQRWAFFL